MNTKNQQELDSFIYSVQNIENAKVDSASFDAIMLKVRKAPLNSTLSIIPQLKLAAASVALLILINLFAIIKMTSADRKNQVTDPASKVLVEDYNINR